MSAEGPRVAEVGEYRVIIVGSRHEILRSLVRVALKKYPSIGEGLDLEGRPYRVVDVRSVDQEEEGFTQFVYTDLLVVVQEDGSPPPWAGTDGPDATGGESATATDPNVSAPCVVPFSPKELDPGSPVMGFMILVAWAVAWAYKEQTLQFENLKFAAWQLEWSGRRWLLARLTDGQSASELRELSRAAKRYGGEAEAFLRGLPPPSNSPGVVDLASYRRKRTTAQA